jgi:hypothetical protein
VRVCDVAFVLEYAERPINQHCFFESAMRLKYEEFSYALFEDEEGFYDFCRKYKTTYFVYNAHMLLRDDPGMSFRYIADGWGGIRIGRVPVSFPSESLKHFELVRQSGFLRVYRVASRRESGRKGESQRSLLAAVRRSAFREGRYQGGRRSAESGRISLSRGQRLHALLRAEALLAAGASRAFWRRWWR